MEDIEITSWKILDAIQKEAEVEEVVGDLQTGHQKSYFCIIEDDFIELVYSDTASNYIRCFSDREEFDAALEERKEDVGDAPFEEEPDFDENFEHDEASNRDDLSEDLEL